MFIYKITNIITDKVYIGQTTGDWKLRWWHHKNNALINKNDCILLENAIRKYNKEDFICEPLIECSTQQELDESEVAFIAFYDSRNRTKGYNIREGGSTGKLAEETKKQISQSKMGHSVSIETRNKLALANIGKKQSPETLAKKSASMTGKKFPPRSAEYRAKMSLSKKGQGKGRIFSPEHRAKLSKALMGNTNGHQK